MEGEQIMNMNNMENDPPGQLHTVYGIPFNAKTNSGIFLMFYCFVFILEIAEENIAIFWCKARPA